MLEHLKLEVFEANLLLPKYGLVLFTWGNVSGIDRDSGLVVIKPSGVDYDALRPDDMVVVELSSGRVIEGSLKPSSDTPTHLELYRHFPSIGGIAHSHSPFATAFAQAKRPIPPLGTTHADYFFGEIPCTRDLSSAQIERDYESETGLIIVERFAELGLIPSEMPAVLVASHAPFTWSTSPSSAVHISAVLEFVANIASSMLSLSASHELLPIPHHLLVKHFFRKHGSNAYYGQ